MQWMADNAAEIKEKGSKLLFGNGEFKVGPSSCRAPLIEVTNCAVFVRLCLYPHLNYVGSLVLLLLHWNAPVYYCTEMP